MVTAPERTWKAGDRVDLVSRFHSRDDDKRGRLVCHYKNGNHQVTTVWWVQVDGRGEDDLRLYASTEFTEIERGL